MASPYRVAHWISNLNRVSTAVDSDLVSLTNPEEMSEKEIDALVEKARPSLPVVNGTIEVPSNASFASYLHSAKPSLDRVLPSVGAIEAVNLTSEACSIGTAWLIEDRIAITNRHVAKLATQSDKPGFPFKLGSAGQPVRLHFVIDQGGDLSTIKRIHVARVLWLETEENRADVAFLELETSDFELGVVPLSNTDPVVGNLVAAIGHPAPLRGSPAKVFSPSIPQKRVSPGVVTSDEQQWATHDCSTLGDVSGALILDLQSGKAAGLHFGAPEPFEGKFIKASTIARCLRLRPWQETRDIPHNAINSPITLDVPISLNLSVRLTSTADQSPGRPPIPPSPMPGPLPPPTGSATLARPDDSPDDDDKTQRVSLFYATSRQRDITGTTYFTGERDEDRLTYGTAVVSIPESHKIGRIELPLKLQLFSFLLYEQQPDRQKHFVIETIDVLPESDWKSLITSTGRNEALVFVHGFRVSFASAVYQLAQITWDLQYRGLPVLFSWPSRGLLLDYKYDNDSAMSAREEFVVVLRQLRDSGIARIHLLAHSMGNLLSLDALYNLARPDLQSLNLAEVVMAAPDVDMQHYKKISRKIAGSFGMTLYASAADQALRISRQIAGKVPRAGDVPPKGPIVIDGVDTIDVTALGKDMFGFGHSTYAENRSVLNDLGLVLSGLRPPHHRLREMRGMPSIENAKWWRFVP